jgi:hypothetical protein
VDTGLENDDGLCPQRACCGFLAKVVDDSEDLGGFEDSESLLLMYNHTASEQKGGY